MSASKAETDNPFGWLPRGSIKLFHNRMVQVHEKQEGKNSLGLSGREKLVNVVRAALDNNMTVAEMKAALVKENPGHEVTFKVE